MHNTLSSYKAKEKQQQMEKKHKRQTYNKKFDPFSEMFSNCVFFFLALGKPRLVIASSLTHIFISTFRYEIMNFQRVEPGVYDYINIGSWHEGILSIDDDMMMMNRSNMVRSVCSEPCSKGEIKVGSKCLAYYFAQSIAGINLFYCLIVLFGYLVSTL